MGSVVYNPTSELGDPHCPYSLLLSLLPQNAREHISYHFLARKITPPISEIVGDPSSNPFSSLLVNTTGWDG